ncbi:DegV family protein [Pseudogracilibacillus sp. ICA-222130]|uniref:DegV family protein n=1 Tax=Pseudogracilibacillus sp. ICA-222130 TaxID=3134655 RepID=UPI0030BC0FA3
MKLAVVTDSTAYIPEDLLEKYNIYTIPLSVIFGEESYREGIDITTEKFYEKVKKEKKLPTTSQPPIGGFVDLFEHLAEQYDAVISIHLSSKFSGTFDAAKTASSMVNDIEVYPFDSELSTMPQGFFVLEAAELAQKGAHIDDVIQRLNEMKEKTRAYFMVDDLSHLQRGGRLNSAQAILGSLLNIKPILHIVDGLIIPFEKIRTRKKAVARIMSMLEEDIEEKEVKRVVFIHANNEQQVMKIHDKFAKKYPHIETLNSYFGPVIGTHLGEGSIGVSWQTK